jgi:hypothetical protein
MSRSLYGTGPALKIISDGNVYLLVSEEIMLMGIFIRGTVGVGNL